MSQTSVERPSVRWTWRRKIALLAAMVVVVCGVPYFVPVSPSVSVSYIAGFNNRVAAMLFVGCVALFAWVTRGEFAVMEGGDSELGVGALWVSMGIVLLVCLAHRSPMLEAVYFLDRQQMLAAGLTPYKQFEFAYGPLLLYPGVWMGFWTWWMVQWLAGTAMMWAVVRGLDVPVRRRVWVFWFLVLMQLGAVVLQGPNYAPMRAYAAAFLIYAAHWVWKRTGSGWWFGAAGVVAVALGLGCSTEQGVGVAVGLAVYRGMGTWARRADADLGALLVLVGGSLACFGVAAHFGMLVTARAFTAGGMSFPLMPSPSILLMLLAYVVAGCVGYGVWLRGDRESVVVPLVLGGMAMMPAALGRCDLFHVGAAAPALVVGVAGIAGMPALRRWWFPLTLAGVWALTWHTFASNGFVQRGDLRRYVQPEVSAQRLPCDRRHFFPTYFPPLTGSLRMQCVEPGYFFHATGNLLTPEGVARKMDELREHVSEPLLAYDWPLEEQYPVAETNTRAVRWQELSPFVPRARNAPVSYAPVVSFLRDHWTPEPVVGDTGVRVWNPK